MPSEKERIINWLYRQAFSDAILSFDDILFEAVSTVLHKAPMEVEAFVHRNQHNYWNNLLEQQDIDLRLGRVPLFLIPDTTTRKMLWTAGNFSCCKSSKDKSYVLRLQTRPYVMQNIDVLSDRDYEALGCMVCELIGATYVKLTPPGNEGGIDFFALVNLPSKSHIFRGDCRPIRIVGQSKMYRSRVGVDKVKELCETLNNVRNLNPAVFRHIPSWFLSSSGPIVGWLVTHSGLQSGAVTHAKNNGIIVSDSKDIAEIVALSRKLDVSLEPIGRAALIRNGIERYLKNCEYISEK